MGWWRGVDWQRPWLGPYRTLGEATSTRLECGDRISDALNVLAGQVVAPRFVEQAALPPGVAYETFIQQSGCVPTRANLHDFFNALVWLRWPALKRRVNDLQARQIARHGVTATRGALRDALTLFDENGALWQAPDELVDALRRRDWQTLFIVERQRWDAAPLTLIGHALLEKLVQPRKPITAHVWVIAGAADDAADVVVRQAHMALPVLGVPGWWPANESEVFYRDAGVFRPPRG
jgi:hypothetical protein